MLWWSHIYDGLADFLLSFYQDPLPSLHFPNFPIYFFFSVAADLSKMLSKLDQCKSRLFFLPSCLHGYEIEENHRHKRIVWKVKLFAAFKHLCNASCSPFTFTVQ